jgi:transcription antitermination factor NusG
VQAMGTVLPNEEFYSQAAWYAIYTQHQHEKVVANLLSKKNFAVFLPLYTAQRQWTDRTKQLSLPLFPSYVFVHTCLRERIEVLRTPGVYQFVGFGGVPHPIPNDEIEAVQRAIEHSLAIEPHPYLHRGDRVRVKSGPLVASEGILVRMKNQYRLVLSIELLNRSVAVEVEQSEVEPVQPTVSVPAYGTREGISLR